MAKNRPVAGFECFLYYDTADNTATPTWEPIPQARDVAEPSAMDEIDASSKASTRKRYIPGQEDAAIEFDYLFVQGGEDEVFNFLQDRYYSREAVHAAVADEEIDAVGTIYLRDWFCVTKFEAKQELATGRLYSVVLKPTPHFTSGVLDEFSYETVAAP